MNDGSEWIAWVGPARKRDPAAIEKLELYFSPFVHAVALARVAHHAAARLVKPALAQALARISEVPNDAEFAGLVLMAARGKATEAARAPGAMTERPTGAPSLSGALLLEKMRLLAEAPRERLLMRLLEGLAGLEIAQFVGGNPAEVRAELERAASALVQHLGAQAVSFTGDNYLWSLVGAPHPALIPLENQLTGLRYDPAAPVTPSSSALPRVKPEGQRPTSAGLAAVTADTTEPSGGKLGTLAEHTEEPPRGVQPLQSVPAVASDSVKNPFGTSVKTIGVAELPAAADFADLQPTTPGVLEPPLDAFEDSPTIANPVPVTLTRNAGAGATEIRPSRPALAKSVDPNLTVVRPVALGDEKADQTRAVAVPRPGAWRSSNVLDAPPLGLPTVAVAGGSVTRSWRPFAVAGVFGLIAIGVSLLLFDGTVRQVSSGWTLVPVIVAATEISEGAVVSLEMISQRAVPEQFVTSSVVRPDSLESLVGQKLLMPVQAGDPLLWSQFESSRAGERLSKKVTRHARAYDLLTSATIAVGGWVQPNDHIDIIASLKANTGDVDRLAVTLLQDVTVLSTGKLTEGTPETVAQANGKEYADVSLLLLPEEAEILALANHLAQLQFTLRTEEDHDVVADHRGSSSKTLLEGERVRLLQLKRFKTIQQIRSARPP